MENLKRQKVKAYILLEALVALAIFSVIATIVLDGIRTSRRAQKEILEREEVLQVAQMAIQTEQKTLTINGFNVQVEKDDSSIIIYREGKEVLHIEKR